MAYRRSSGYRSRSYGPRRSSGYSARRAPARGRSRRRSSAPRRSSGGQTIRLVIEGVPASGVSRPSINPVPGVPLTGPKKAKL